MSHEERRDSLADQAAAWIPPWQRPAPPAETAPTDRATTVPVQGRPTDDAVDDADEVGAQRPDEPTDPSRQEAAGDAPTPASVPTPEEQAAAAPATVPAGEPVAGQTTGERAGAAGADVGGAVARKQRSGRTRPAPEPTPSLDDTELRGALEAILLVVDEPVSELTLAQVLEQPPERIGPMLDDIAAGYTAAGHGFDLRRAAGGWRLYTRPEYASYVERFVLDGQSVRITQAALETLAVVAYKQPVTRSRISAIRGVNCDGVIRTLVSRGLVEECGTESDSGAFLYRTTTMFLEKLGLNSLDDLPPLAPFLPDDVEELADASR
ncbi:SMC-Scp complex subunit ScpB [Micromonospora sp. NPDC051196]|uniref:SMC-Scp complex subunit ScpB n=1 Tax=Micromonospora sp. NPDC051196 TaxID=3155281 RepID=UPI00341333E9